MKSIAEHLNKNWHKWSDSAISDHREQDKWVRFHTLPESKRYADSEAELGIILARHRTLLSELHNTPNQLLVATSVWTTREEVPSVAQAGYPDLQLEHWKTIFDNPEEEDVEFHRFQHLFVGECLADAAVLAKLLDDIAEDRKRGAIIMPRDLKWLYFPYDGGADILFKSQAECDSLKMRHKDWLSSGPNGL